MANKTNTFWNTIVPPPIGKISKTWFSILTLTHFLNLLVVIWKEKAFFEISVHPHNEAGLATCKSICQEWNGLAIEGFVPIEIDDRTIPHVLHLIQLNRGD